MSGVRFTFGIDGKAQFDRAFNSVDDTLKDFNPVWGEVREELYEIMQDQFQSGGAAGASGKWAELAPATEKQKIARLGTFAVIAGPLIATGDMSNSLMRHTSDSIFESSKDEMAFGTSDKKAIHHQRGGGNLPQREIFSFSDKQKKGIQKRIQKKLVEIMRGNGFVANEENFADVG